MAGLAATLYSDAATKGTSAFFEEPAEHVTFNFDGAIAAPESIPVEDLAAMAARVAKEQGSAAWGYYDEAVGYSELTFGYGALRDQIAARIQKRDDRDLGRDGIILTSGAVQAIALAAKGYLGPGDGVIVEEASFPYAVSYMADTGAAVAKAHLDEHGLIIDSVEDCLQDLRGRGIRPKMIYTIATFQTPTGACMPLNRRKELLELASRWGILILEDNVWGELRYEGDDLPTLLSLDEAGGVIQVDGFSKTLAPGLRLGWMAGTSEAIAALGAVRQDLGVSQWLSRMMELYLAEGMFDPHLEKVRTLYRDKRDTAHRALQEHCRPWVQYRVPQGAMYFWMEMSDAVDWHRVKDALVPEGIYCHPGETLPSLGDQKQFLRMAFCQVPAAELERGIAALGRAVSQNVLR